MLLKDFLAGHKGMARKLAEYEGVATQAIHRRAKDGYKIGVVDGVVCMFPPSRCTALPEDIGDDLRSVL